MSDFEMVPVAPAVTGFTFAFTFHMRSVFIVRSSYYYYYFLHLLNGWMMMMMIIIIIIIAAC
jgi:hypothetical protein